MDSPALGAAELEPALRGLARLNRVSGAAGSLWRIIRPMAAVAPRPLRVLDVATGSGDVPVRLALMARQAGIELELHACDLRPEMLAAAKRRAQGVGLTLDTFVFDATGDALPLGFDVATVSLFCHHLDEREIVALLAQMARAARVVIVNDLERSALGMALVWLGSRALSRSRIVHVDSMLSVRAGFTLAEFASLASRAGLRDFTLRREFPARFVMIAHTG